MTPLAKNQKKSVILIIEDEATIRDMVKYALGLSGFLVEEAENFNQAVQVIGKQTPDLILLDWMLPGVDGLEIVRRFKREPKTKDIPIIMLTAKAEESSKVKGLESGADDYVVKPFSPRELIARIKAVLRRNPLINADGCIEVAALWIDTQNQQVTIHDKPVELKPLEYRLLCFFVSHQNRVYTRQQIIDAVWGNDSYIDERSIDVQIGRLRKVLRDYQCGDVIQTIRGSGYRFMISS